MKAANLFLGIGAGMVLLGILALANPFTASLAVTTFVGILFLLGGVAQAWLTFRGIDAEHRMSHGVIALLNIVVGVWLLANPLSGTASLTFVVGALFLIMGAMRLIVGLRMPRHAMRPLLWFTGLASIVIGVVIFSDFQNVATKLLGVLLGVQLLLDGLGLLVLGLSGRGPRL
ncbi:HdeD family acid-resistance protein [Thioclava sp. 15-R06ZXC-3]|uniref:HdeD family acid-resistance protein n=1 Tax=Thioclava arctica TaxID=3238301 RepID=A0ABV3TIC1_9RHOB